MNEDGERQEASGEKMVRGSRYGVLSFGRMSALSERRACCEGVVLLNNSADEDCMIQVGSETPSRYGNLRKGGPSTQYREPE